jgi:hypothetical protein
MELIGEAGISLGKLMVVFLIRLHDFRRSLRGGSLVLLKQQSTPGNPMVGRFTIQLNFQGKFWSLQPFSLQRLSEVFRFS